MNTVYDKSRPKVFCLYRLLWGVGLNIALWVCLKGRRMKNGQRPSFLLNSFIGRQGPIGLQMNQFRITQICHSACTCVVVSFQGQCISWSPVSESTPFCTFVSAFDECALWGPSNVPMSTPSEVLPMVRWVRPLRSFQWPDEYVFWGPSNGPMSTPSEVLPMFRWVRPLRSFQWSDEYVLWGPSNGPMSTSSEVLPMVRWVRPLRSFQCSDEYALWGPSNGPMSTFSEVLPMALWVRPLRSFQWSDDPSIIFRGSELFQTILNFSPAFLYSVQEGHGPNLRSAVRSLAHLLRSGNPRE